MTVLNWLAENWFEALALVTVAVLVREQFKSDDEDDDEDKVDETLRKPMNENNDTGTEYDAEDAGVRLECFRVASSLPKNMGASFDTCLVDARTLYAFVVGKTGEEEV